MGTQRSEDMWHAPVSLISAAKVVYVKYDAGFEAALRPVWILERLILLFLPGAGTAAGTCAVVLVGRAPRASVPRW